MKIVKPTAGNQVGRLTKDELAALVAAGKVHESFTHSEMGTFDITLMRQRAEKQKMPVHEVLLNAEVYTFLATHRDIDQARIENLKYESWNCDPAIIIKCKDGTMLVVDGNHRIMRRFEEGKDFFLTYFFEEDEAVRVPPDFRIDTARQWGSMTVDSDGKLSHKE